MQREQEQRLTTKERIAQDRSALHEILINAILFGLALNLIADFFSGLPDTFFNPLSWILLLVAIVMTVGSYYILVRQYLGDESVMEYSLKVGLFVNSENGELVNLDYPYLAQLIIHEHIKQLPEKKQAQYDKSLKNIGLKTQVDVIGDLFETLLRYYLGDSDKYPPPFQLGDSSLTLDFSVLRKEVPDSINIGSGRFKNGVCKLKVQNGKGSLSYSYQIKNVSYEPEIGHDRPIEFQQLHPFFEIPEALRDHIKDERVHSPIVLIEFDLDISIIFSAVGLHAKGEKVADIIETVEEFLRKMVFRLDWLIQQQTVGWSKDMMDYGRGLGFDKGGFL